MVCLQSGLLCLLKQRFTLSPACCKYLEKKTKQFLIPSWDQLQFSRPPWDGWVDYWAMRKRAVHQNEGNWLKRFLTLHREWRRIVNLKYWCDLWFQTLNNYRSTEPNLSELVMIGLEMYHKTQNYRYMMKQEITISFLTLTRFRTRFPLFEQIHFFTHSRQFLLFPTI